MLNERQRTYLQAIFDTDQEVEAEMQLGPNVDGLGVLANERSC